MPKKYPPLSPNEVIYILLARGFVFDHQRSSHRNYTGTVKGLARLVTVDMHYSQFDDELIKKIISQSGLSYEEFYCSVKKTAKKINKTVARIKK